jgi:hypothetical protein
VCCGTKRLTEISCPADCGYLASARDHPPAVTVRRQQRDIGLLVQSMRDFNRRQTELFFAVNSCIARHAPPELQPLVDDDVREATGAVAATLETSTRGVIYEHRPSSLPAGRLAGEIRALLTEIGKNGGTAFERDSAQVLRRVEDAVREAGSRDPTNRRAFLDWLSRVIRADDGDARPSGPHGEASGLILP